MVQQGEMVIDQADTSDIDSRIKSFEIMYKSFMKELGDSIKKAKPNSDDSDFSDLTEGIERRYNKCRNEFDKTLIGYKLARYYMIDYDGGRKPEDKQKAEPLFCAFISFWNGELASRYLKLDIGKVRYMAKEWNNFSDKDKETLLFYGLLRGFDNGLPAVLEHVK
ncbi:MAG: hypothetical protein AB2L24_00940 [Mangrovibacterium sp.]